MKEVILKHPAVDSVAVIGIPDKQRGEIVKALVVLNQNFKPSDELVRDIQRFAKTCLSKYAYPQKIEFIKEIPKAIDDKIKRKELKERSKN